MSSFDRIVITAANKAQARGYRAQLAGLWKNVTVVPDPGERRVGSLGATVNVLRKLKYSAASGGLVLVCHSGGDSRRTPSFAAIGKAFIPMRDNRPLFEHIVEAMEKLTLPKAGVLVVSGDVLPIFDYGSADFSQPGVTGVAYPGPAAEARRHGVYIAGKGSRVKGFLQKPQVEDGEYLIDTGIMFIDAKTAGKMVTLPIEGDIYSEFPKMLLEGFAPFNVCNAGRGLDFFHVGSSRELLEKLGDCGKYVRNVHCELDLAGENIVTNVPKGMFKRLSLARGECFTAIPYDGNKYLKLKYNIDDNFKTDGLWEKYDLGSIMKRVDHTRLVSLIKSRAVKVVAPARIDLAGGWSDTPPICIERGGAVANIAVTLEGVKPICVKVKDRRDRYVKIVSKDLGKRALIKDQVTLDARRDPSDWCALVKNALFVTGFKFGRRGLDIEISADLPKGSGLGTSSILGAATIAALLGRVDADELGELTLRLEQEMSTGGGWQDQFGGMLPGGKLLESEPGTPQNIKSTRFPNEQWLSKLLKERGLLYFTGQKRMARNILRKVLSFYAENPHGFAHILVDSLKADAKKCFDSVSRCDAKGLCEAVSGYWRDKKLLDPGSTNERIEELVALAQPYSDAITLTGAAGGGFMFIIAKSRNDAAKIKKLFTTHAPSGAAKFYSFALDTTGIELSTDH